MGLEVVKGPPILGIDLGTTYSLVGALQDGAPVLFPNALGELLTPSAVSVDEQGKIMVGAAARARAVTHPEATRLAFKRDMGTDVRYELAGQFFTPIELSALVLGALKADAEAALGTKIEEAVVTVPAYFGDLQRQATKQAAQLAGLRVDRILNEPTAAALAYGLHSRDRELKIAVLDLGGGTFDVTLLEIMEGVIEIKASAGDARLGGEDFTDALAAHVVKAIVKRFGDMKALSAVASARIREACDRAKASLTTRESALVALPALGLPFGARDVEVEVGRSEAEEQWRPLLERMRGPIARAIRDAKLAARDIDEVLLVGGATRMPCVSRLAAEIFGRLPLRHLPPDEAVAMGACVQAALKQGDAAVDDLVVTDVAPFSMGIATSTWMGRQAVSGLYSPILERGTVIPASREQRFHTMDDDQTELRIEVFQGEHALVKDNTKLGEYVVKGLPKKRAGEQSIRVRFTYDLNGILEVDMGVDGTERSESFVIEGRPGALSQAELARARTAMQRLKLHPRDALPNATALARADALFVESTGPTRMRLGTAIAAFKAAIEAQDNVAIAHARERLNALVSSVRKDRQ